MEINVDNNKLHRILELNKFRSYKDFEIEQIGYRMYLCNNCIENKACEKCGCQPLDVLGDRYSCNEEKFPNLLSLDEWKNFKNNNNINKINYELL